MGWMGFWGKTPKFCLICLLDTQTEVLNMMLKMSLKIKKLDRLEDVNIESMSYRSPFAQSLLCL